MLLGESSKRFYTKSEEERNPTVSEFLKDESCQEATISESVFNSEEE